MTQKIELTVYWEDKPINVSGLDDAVVDEVAFRMCAAMGFNPTEHATYPAYETIFNIETPQASQRLSIGLTVNGNGAGQAMSQEFLVAPYHVQGPRWKSFRRRAAEAIAGWNAVHATIMGS